VSETTDGHITAPEPDLTPQELIARAAALRPMLVERQAEVEERTYYAEDVHRELQAAGIYRTFVPRRYGGYAFDVPTFARIGIELARGCPSTAWCAALASNHALHVGSFFPEQAQAEAFGDGEFRAPAVTAPIGVAQRTADAGSSPAASPTAPARRTRRTTWARRSCPTSTAATPVASSCSWRPAANGRWSRGRGATCSA
jgi:alkylation response protein AidB-like acyl-CoA dehydrogenase